MSDLIGGRIKVLESSIKSTTSLGTKIHLEMELDRLKSNNKTIKR